MARHGAMKTRVQFEICGLVQGVGFRPFVYTVAARSALKGSVRNSTSGVLIDVEGEPDVIERFIEDVRLHPPTPAKIESIARSNRDSLENYDDFRIVASTRGELHRSLSITPDLAVCGDCLSEMRDPLNRRFQYPFINCANCGPRFTIVEDLPYDRAATTMRSFVMCADCSAEYENPRDRRFHAEATCCPACGPQLGLNGSIDAARDTIQEGKIVAIKGIGGFHLSCDALNAAGVDRLRQRKWRDDKPLALMARSPEVIRRFCVLSEREEQLLMSPSRPIVILERKSGISVPDALAPGLKTLGFMLPYSPLHHLLLDSIPDPVVMTSGNRSDEPICITNEDAVDKLSDIADYFLIHNRAIHTRADDSIVRGSPRGHIRIRRSRGFTPEPIKAAVTIRHPLLACGAGLKNTFCVAAGQRLFLSHHIGDLENVEMLDSYKLGIDRLQRLLAIQPELVAYDLHPEYLSTKYALGLPDFMPKVAVQHHHAHIAACMADNMLDGDVIGIAMDGLGLGRDGHFWGGECFIADFRRAERIAHLDYVPMPGATNAIREPWRMALAYLHRAFGDSLFDLPVIERWNQRSAAALLQMISAGIQSPLTSSTGRLFDAIASLLGLRDRVRYEGQAAMELEAIADPSVAEAYEFELSGGRVYAADVIRGVVHDITGGIPASTVSAKFHLGLAQLIEHLARYARRESGFQRVVLSGGVFQNLFLLERACLRLEKAGFDVYTHNEIPANDGGISVGQAMVANALVQAGEV